MLCILVSIYTAFAICEAYLRFIEVSLYYISHNLDFKRIALRGGCLVMNNANNTPVLLMY